MRSTASVESEKFGQLRTDDFQFRRALDQADGPESFIDVVRRNAPMFGEVRFSDVRRVVDGSRAVNLYTFEVGPRTRPDGRGLRDVADRFQAPQETGLT